MNIPAAADAKTATLEACARKKQAAMQAALDEQAGLIERRIQECIADGLCGFSQMGRLDARLKFLLEQKGYFCGQFNHPQDSYYTIEWETPLPVTTP